ncbi:MAG: radical SAM protein [Chloroflexi bacterium]|nr:radical SAM protein [Chloroflexota bacterium]MBM3172207.1 radical SAM protein [Chloroflexota bacterium]MBM3174199.1 radical SAM protein [Chloroflexota bacterium]MBM4449892.1 radical SAM protein [Chloroflexota bacterium]
MSKIAERQETVKPELRMVAWEITRGCNLLCAHCRASSTNTTYEDELSTEECLRLVDEIAGIGKPVLILTGGEPLLRPDLEQIGKYAVGRGLKVVIGTNGTLLTKEMTAKLKEIPVPRLAISIDFPTPELQDKFRGQPGAFQAAMSGITNTRQAGIEVQINSTITKMNAKYLDELVALAFKVGAVAFHPFMLVPTGRGKGLAEVEMSPQEYEQTLNWVYDKQKELGDRMFFKPTDAAHYLRIVKQRTKEDRAQENKSHAGHSSKNPQSRGCLAGISFCFISHRGRVQGCGYLDVEAGNVRERGFKEIWENANLFRELRDLSNIKGKCRICEYKRVCGGCRARAYEATGDYLQEEPYCIYEPLALRSTPAKAT